MLCILYMYLVSKYSLAQINPKHIDWFRQRSLLDAFAWDCESSKGSHSALTQVCRATCWLMSRISEPRDLKSSAGWWRDNLVEPLSWISQATAHECLGQAIWWWSRRRALWCSPPALTAVSEWIAQSKTQHWWFSETLNSIGHCACLPLSVPEVPHSHRNRAWNPSKRLQVIQPVPARSCFLMAPEHKSQGWWHSSSHWWRWFWQEQLRDPAFNLHVVTEPKCTCILLVTHLPSNCARRIKSGWRWAGWR